MAYSSIPHNRQACSLCRSFRKARITALLYILAAFGCLVLTMTVSNLIGV